MMNFALKTKNWVLKTRNYVSKTRNCVFKRMDFAASPVGGWVERGDRGRPLKLTITQLELQDEVDLDRDSTMDEDEGESAGPVPPPSVLKMPQPRRVSRLLIYQAPACSTDLFTILTAVQKVSTLQSNEELCISNDEFCR